MIETRRDYRTHAMSLHFSQSFPKKFIPPDLREADPQAQRGAEREPLRTLHAARRGSSDGRSNAGWRESAKSNPMYPTPGSIRISGTKRTARSASWATKSTSIATSTDTPRPALWRRSKRISAPSSRTSCECWVR
jgi:hypothetical protein